MSDLVKTMMEAYKYSPWLTFGVFVVFLVINNKHWFDFVDAAKRRKILRIQDAINSGCMSEHQMAYLKESLNIQLFSLASGISLEDPLLSRLFELRKNSSGRLSRTDVLNVQAHIELQGDGLKVSDIGVERFLAILNLILAILFFVISFYFILYSAFKTDLSASGHLIFTAIGMFLFALGLLPLYFTKTYTSMKKVAREINHNGN